jgi:hypothetical protein
MIRDREFAAGLALCSRVGFGHLVLYTRLTSVAGLSSGYTHPGQVAWLRTWN